MSQSSRPLTDALGRLFEGYRLTLRAPSPYELILTQQLKSWTYLFLAIWSASFVLIPATLIGLFVLECQEINSCQPTQFAGLLLVTFPLILTGLLVAYSKLRKRVFVLDKVSGSYTQKVHTLLGIRTKTYPLNEVEFVNIIKMRRHRQRHTYYVYQLVIYLRNHRAHRFSKMRTRQAISGALVQMRAFLEKSSN